MSFLDNNGLTYLWSIIEDRFATQHLMLNIPTSSWTGSDPGPYTFAFDDAKITETMVGVKTWIDTPVDLGSETTFTTVNGRLTISTPVRPASAVTIHIMLQDTEALSNVPSQQP